ncbi:hypothetical protein RND81_14G041900 [Saponaria officinalis]|uniref:RNase H type-1 domain-containing protein n=1 Tax=Saponaria officinalis TaxID=3572 RepID=A0AAW1GNA2_SAPOF
MARSLGMKTIVLECDALLLVQSINAGSVVKSPWGLLIEDIRESVMLPVFSSLVFVIMSSARGILWLIIHGDRRGGYIYDSFPLAIITMAEFEKESPNTVLDSKSYTFTNSQVLCMCEL